jgi:predicted amidohydrolase YtcJ
MIIRQAEIAGCIRDVRMRDGQVAEIAETLQPEPREEILEANCGALLPGLHDHHLHLHSLAAALASVDCGPAECPDEATFAEVLGNAVPDRGWIRGTGYFESIAGPLDRHRIDAIRSDVPIRIQHRSGVMWFLNSRAIDELELDLPGGEPATRPAPEPNSSAPERTERDSAGRATGQLFRADRWLRDLLPQRSAPDLAPVGRLLAGFGVIAVTDATPTNTEEEAEIFRRAQVLGALPQHVQMMGTLTASSPIEQTNPEFPSVVLDAVKIMLDEPVLPNFDDLVTWIRAAHDRGRTVAIHTVTRAEIHFALAALDSAGALVGDRLEHASVTPPEAFETIRRLGVTIVTQPNFVRERGDHYQEEVDARDQPYLYRVRSWLGGAVPLWGGTDAPFGDPDPWRAMQAAVDRTTKLGHILGADERVSPEIALGLFMSNTKRASQSDTNTIPQIAIGDPADVCLLDCSWQTAREDLTSDRVVATLCRGEIVYRS